MMELATDVKPKHAETSLKLGTSKQTWEDRTE